MPLFSPEFLLTSLIVVASPGTGAVYTVAAGLSRGAQASVLAFLPQFVAVDDPAPVVTMALLSSVFVAMTFVIFAVYGLFAAQMRDRVMQSPAALRWLRRGFAAAFVALGARLALAER